MAHLTVDRRFWDVCQEGRVVEKMGSWIPYRRPCVVHALKRVFSGRLSR